MPQTQTVTEIFPFIAALNLKNMEKKIISMVFNQHASF